jgi:DNA polymerase I-like protein with 3'-5' exonuclease and polymerase domains
LRVRLHSHDEVLCEAKEAAAGATAMALHDVMVEGFTWSHGLPLAADTTIARFYTKCKSSIGL